MRLWSIEKAEYIEETRRRKAAAKTQFDDGETPITHLARTFRTLADESQVLHLLNRYETRFSREYTRPWPAPQHSEPCASSASASEGPEAEPQPAPSAIAR